MSVPRDRRAIVRNGSTSITSNLVAKVVSGRVYAVALTNVSCNSDQSILDYLGVLIGCRGGLMGSRNLASSITTQNGDGNAAFVHELAIGMPAESSGPLQNFTLRGDNVIIAKLPICVIPHRIIPLQQPSGLLSPLLLWVLIITRTKYVRRSMVDNYPVDQNLICCSWLIS